MSIQFKNNYEANFDSIKADYALQGESIAGTKQVLIKDASGNPQKLQHIDSNNVVIREDVYIFSSTTITEVRTFISTGEHLTITVDITSNPPVTNISEIAKGA